MRRITTSILFSILAFALFAQQESTSSQYMLNPLAVNPAYAGYYNALSTSAMYRFQSLGLEGAPNTQSFIVHSPLRQRYAAVGMQISNQSLGASRQLGAFLSGAYRLDLGPFKIAAGLQGGLRFTENNLTGLSRQQANDPVFSQDVRSWTPSLGAGVFLHNEKLFAGISMPEMMRFQGTDLSVTNRPLILMGGYVLPINENIKFRPTGLIRIVDMRVVEFNANASLVFKDVLVGGVGYRPNNAFIFLLQFFLTDQLQLGYTYDAIINELAPVTTGSHEIALQYIFRFSRKHAISPRYF